MKLRNIACFTIATLGVGATAGFAIRNEIPMPLSWVNPILAKYDKNSDEILSTEEVFDLINNEIDQDKDGNLSKEEYEASKRFIDYRSFLPPPKNIMKSIDNYNSAIHTKITTDFLNHRLEEQNNKQWIPVEAI